MSSAEWRPFCLGLNVLITTFCEPDTPRMNRTVSSYFSTNPNPLWFARESRVNATGAQYTGIDKMHGIWYFLWYKGVTLLLQWNLSVTTTSIINYITCDLFSNVF